MLLFCSCGKCSYKQVGNPYCVQGYDEWEDAEIKEVGWHEDFGVNSPYIIKSQAEYDSLLPNYRPFDMDFERYSLLGVDVGTDWGRKIRTIGWVCRKADTKEVKMYVKYSLSEQCAGSGIGSHTFSYWAKVPKLSDDDRVYFHVIDVNPYD